MHTGGTGLLPEQLRRKVIARAVPCGRESHLARPFARELPRNVASIYLVGEATEQLAAALDAAGHPYSRDGDLAHAVEHARADAEPGDVVLLSPAAASFDQFDDFEQRGDTFRRLVQELA